MCTCLCMCAYIIYWHIEIMNCNNFYRLFQTVTFLSLFSQIEKWKTYYLGASAFPV